LIAKPLENAWKVAAPQRCPMEIRYRREKNCLSSGNDAYNHGRT